MSHHSRTSLTFHLIIWITKPKASVRNFMLIPFNLYTYERMLTAFYHIGCVLVVDCCENPQGGGRKRSERRVFKVTVTVLQNEIPSKCVVIKCHPQCERPQMHHHFVENRIAYGMVLPV